MWHPERYKKFKSDLEVYCYSEENCSFYKPINLTLKKRMTDSYLKQEDLEIVAASNKSYIKLKSFSEIEQIQE